MRHRAIVYKFIHRPIDGHPGSSGAKIYEEDYSTAFRLSEEALEVWNNDHKALSFYTTHEQLEQIDLSFAVLLVHLERGNYDDFLSEKNKAAAQLENVRDNEMPSLHNLF